MRRHTRHPSVPESVRVFAPASVANFGVGFDALGAALDGPGDIVTARLSETPGVRLVSVTGDDGRLPREPALNTASVAAAAVLELFAATSEGAAVPGLELGLEKGLPLASGLGSSAASAVAGALAAAALLHIDDRLRLLRAVLMGEHAADGSWHGDNVYASLLGGIVLVPSSDPLRLQNPISLPVPEGLRLVLVHPELELPTAEARRVLPRAVELSEHVKHAAAFAQLVAALFQGDLASAGRAVSADRIVETARAPLVPGHAAVVRAMEKAGALGCALAGAGPSIMALTEEGPLPEAIARAGVRAFREAGLAATARVHKIEKRGARILGRGRGRRAP